MSMKIFSFISDKLLIIIKTTISKMNFTPWENIKINHLHEYFYSNKLYRVVNKNFENKNLLECTSIGKDI